MSVWETQTSSMLRSIVFLFLAASSHAVQPGAPEPQPAPLRELPWGQLNFLHTTDTHGWHGGHLQEASYSADWGDYISFATHLRQMADDKGVDMLLVDTGDRIEGNGLYDASNPKGKYTFDIFKHQDIDIITCGNHELYKQNSSENEFHKTVPNFKGNYLASNLDIYNSKSKEFEALAPRYKKFTTKNLGIRVTAFGFLFNFKGNANNTVVQEVEITVKEKWFQDVIKEKDTDLFIVAGHSGADSEEYKTIFKAIREQQWFIPIQFFAGHTHIRDYKVYDSSSVAIESGRYMETIGFMSIQGLNTPKKEMKTTATPPFKRRYIDNNLFSYYHHSELNSSTFPTELGKNVTKQITAARKKLDLDKVHGCAPQDLWVNRAEFASNTSIFSWLGSQVLPDQLRGRKNDTTAKIAITNTGAIRFDIFKGAFTTDSAYLISPFTSGFRVVKNVDYKIAGRLLDVLNSNARVIQGVDVQLDPSTMLAPEQLRVMSQATSKRQTTKESQTQKPLNKEPALIPGYTTKDDDGEDGDDTIHAAIPFFAVPNCIQSNINFPAGDAKPESVDVVYNQFIEPFLFLALRFLGSELDIKDASDYSSSMTSLMTDWVGRNWPCEK